MFKKLKHYSVARNKRKQLLKHLNELKFEDIFGISIEEVRLNSDERLRKLNSTKIQVHQVKRYKKRIPVRVGVA